MEIPAEVTFRQIRSDVLQDILTLRHDRVIIRLGAGDSVDERHVRLEDIDPKIEFAERRSYSAGIVMLALAAVFIAAACKVAGLGLWSLVLSGVFGGMACSCVVAGFIVFARVPTATVRSRAGEPLFKLRREPNVAADYEVFLLNLQRRLKHRCEDSVS